MRILWVSRHQPLPAQVAALYERFGVDTVVEQDARPFDSAEQIAARYRTSGYSDMVVVAPLSVIARLVDLGLRPLWCEMEVVGPEETCDVSYRGRRYKFIRLRRIKMLRLEFED